MAAALQRIDWPSCRRIVATIYPPVSIFEDAGADPADWELLASIAAKTDPRVLDQLGNLRMVPADRRIAGPTASLALGPFCHASEDRPSRFSSGTYGVWYGGDIFEVALMETAFHFERFMRRTNEPAADRDFHELVTHVRGDLHDLSRGYDACLDPDSWESAQREAKALRAAGADGLVYPSVRRPGGKCCALFFPDLIRLPIRTGRNLRYRWDGDQMTGYFVYGEANWKPLPKAA